MGRLDKKELSALLRPLRRRMHANNALYCLFASLAAAGLAAVFLSYAALWLPVPFLTRILFRVYLAGMAAGVLISVFMRPGLKRLISVADSLGLKERVVTAWQLRGDDSSIAALQREDARRAVRDADFKRLYPVRIPVKPAMALAATVLLVLVSFCIPGVARDEARRIEELKKEVGKQTEVLEKAQEGLEKNEALTEKEREKILEEIEALKAELKQSKTEEDALKALSRAENELEKLDMQRQLNQLGEALRSSAMTRELGEALQNENLTDMKQALEQLRQQLEQVELSEEELAEMLEQVAARLENKEDVLSATMQQQDSDGLSQALEQLTQALQQAKGAISQVDNRLGAGSRTAQGGLQSGGQPGNQGSGTPGSREGQGMGGGQQEMGDGGDGDGGGQDGSQPGADEGQLKNGGKGNGSGSGDGGGSDGDGGGGGAGEGSTNEDAGYTGRESSGAGRAPGERKEEDYEMLYDPERLGGENAPDSVSGQKQEGGQSQYMQADNMPVEKGAVLPYREVLAKYRDEASSYMEDTVIPAAMKQIVREYFELLE